MKLSAKSRYGTRLMLDMAQHYPDGPVHLADVPKRQGISVKYLEQIIISLKKPNYIQSVRGPKGGHALARPPEAITVGEIVALLEEGAAWQFVPTTRGLRAFPQLPDSVTSGRRRPRLYLTNCAVLLWPIC